MLINDKKHLDRIEKYISAKIEIGSSLFTPPSRSTTAPLMCCTHLKLQLLFCIRSKSFLIYANAFWLDCNLEKMLDGYDNEVKLEFEFMNVNLDFWQPDQ